MQDNGLIFSIAEPPHVTGIATLFPAVGVGGGAEIHLAISGSPATDQGAFIGLALTSDSNQWYGVEPYAVFAEMDVGSGAFDADYGGTVASSGQGIGTPISAGAEASCTMRVERLSPTQLEASLLNDSGQLLAQEDQICPANSDLLHVQVDAEGLDVTVADLELFGNFVPEPGALGITALMFIGCLSIRKKSVTQRHGGGIRRQG